MKNLILVAILAVMLTAAGLWFLMVRQDQSPASEVIGGSIRPLD